MRSKALLFLYSSEIFRLVKSVLRPDGVFSSHAGGNVCTPDAEVAAGYPGDVCFFFPRFYNTLKATWANVSASVVPMPLWQEFHAFVVATDLSAPHSVSGIQVDHELRKRLTRFGEERHPNLAGKLRYYSSFIHMNMHMLASDYWDFFRKEAGVLTPEGIKEMFKDSGADSQGLSEMKVCSCDPRKCIFANGVRGPLKDIGDVYEVEVNPPNLMDGVRWDSNEEMASEL